MANVTQLVELTLNDLYAKAKVIRFGNNRFFASIVTFAFDRTV